MTTLLAAKGRHLHPRAVYDQLLHHTALTRDEIADLTGLSRVAASASVDVLVERGLAVPAAGHGAGPAAKRFSLTPTAGFVIGADIRHRAMTIAAADLTGHVAARTRVSFDTPDDAADVLERAVRECLASAGTDVARLRRVVLGSPGVIDPVTGEFAWAQMLPSWKRTVTGELRDRLGRPVVFENDVNLAAMAEARFGCGKGVDHLAFAWFEVGVGLGLVLNGRLRRGRSGWAGEIAFMPAPLPPGHVDVDGMRNALHQLASGPAISALAARSGLDDDPATAIANAVARGDDAFLREVARRVAHVVSTVAVLVDPSVLAIDGYVAAGGEDLLGMIRDEVEKIAPVPTPIVFATVRDDPILRGALQTALDDARDELFTA